MPAYRAISPLAVVALVLGVLSVLSFASWYFLTLAVAAVVARLPGRSQDPGVPGRPDGPRAGAGGGRARPDLRPDRGDGHHRPGHAPGPPGQGVRPDLREVLNKGDLPLAVWYGQPPEVRASFKPRRPLQADDGSRPEHRWRSRSTTGRPATSIKALTEPKAAIHFVRVESHGEQDLTQFAGLVYDVHTPGGRKTRPSATARRWSFSRARCRRKGGYAWWVSESVFPYKAKTFVAPRQEGRRRPRAFALS